MDRRGQPAGKRPENCYSRRSSMPKTIYVLNGPNLNLLGTREPTIYGRATLADVEKLCRARAKAHGFAVEFRQSNHEGVIVDWLQEARAKKAVGVVLNPAAYTTTSIAFLDTILAIEIPVIEVHISNIHAREEFRHSSYVSKVAKAVICGFGIEGYGLAIDGLASLGGGTNKKTRGG
jgi:3-dehydroquinate dehydratase-2